MATNTKIDLLRGTIDDDNPLSILRANPLIWSKVFDNVQSWYNAHILRTENAYKVMDYSYLRCMPLQFPAPTNININMMPIKYCEIPGFIPREYHRMYYECMRFSDYNTTAYLTIHESLVQPGESQRRSGLHVERPGSIAQGGNILEKDMSNPEYVKRYQDLAWGLGHWEGGIPKDGIFMMSSVSNSCQIWPLQISNPHEVTDKHGGIEHMRPYMGEPYKLQENELVWFTDTTPHESLPIDTDKPIYRQFFRLVTGKISVWYSKHNTPNPMGVQPDAPISDVDKFA